MTQRQHANARRSIRQRLDGLVRRLVWRMDIHPSVWIASTALIDRTWPKGVHIAKDCIIADEAVLLTHDLTRGIYCDTSVGEGTTIGVRAIVLPGVTIGRDCCIEAGALVNRDVPDGHRAAGNPAVIAPRT